MGKCIKCGAEARYDLCYKCYNEQKETRSIEQGENEKGEPDECTSRNLSFQENMIKGRIAETLIEELFLAMGYNIFRYGMENTIPGVMKLLKGVRGDVAESIKRMPDFVVQDKKGDVYFIEVKFRASETFTKNDLPKNYPYYNAYIVLVSKKHIKCITVQELEEGKEVSPTSRNYIGSRKEFDLDKDMIISFCDFAVKFFENV